jgi:hypothetical protein
MAGCKHSLPDIPHDATITLKVRKSTIKAGESTEVRAITLNLEGGNRLQWSVDRKPGTVTPDQANGAIATFSAGAPGTYVIKASCQMPDGSVVWSNGETVTVSEASRTDHGGVNGPASAPGGANRK